MFSVSAFDLSSREFFSLNISWYHAKSKSIFLVFLLNITKFSSLLKVQKTLKHLCLWLHLHSNHSHHTITLQAEIKRIKISLLFVHVMINWQSWRYFLSCGLIYASSEWSLHRDSSFRNQDRSAASSESLNSFGIFLKLAFPLLLLNANLWICSF